MKVSLHKIAEKAISVLNKVARIKEARDWITYGDRNDLPNEVLAKLASSGTAQIALNRLKKFVIAEGFIEEGLNDLPANGSETFKDLLQKIAFDLAYLRGCAIRVLFDNTGNPGEFYHVPLKHLRRATEGGFVYNPKFGERGFDPKDCVYLEGYTGKEKESENKQYVNDQIAEEGRQFGKIVFFFAESFHPQGDVYPVPPYYSGLEDIEADAALSKIERDNLKRGFQASTIISTGEIDNEEEDENGLTQLDYFDRSLDAFTGEGSSRVLHLMANNDEEKPEIHILDPSPIMDATEKASERIPRKVCRLLEVPPVLCGHSTAGTLGDTQELVNQIELFALTVFDIQELAKRAFEIAAGKKFEGKDFTLSTLKVWRHIPKEVLAKLTGAELRELFEIDLESTPEKIEEEEPKEPKKEKKNVD